MDNETIIRILTEKLEQASQKSGWIKIEDGTPPDDGSVFVWPYPDGEKSLFTGAYDDGCWFDDIHGDVIHVTHWRPLFEGPEDS